MVLVLEVFFLPRQILFSLRTLPRPYIACYNAFVQRQHKLLAYIGATDCYCSSTSKYVLFSSSPIGFRGCYSLRGNQKCTAAGTESFIVMLLVG